MLGPLHHPNSTWREPPTFPQLLLSSRQALSVPWGSPKGFQALGWHSHSLSPWTPGRAWRCCSSSSQAGHFMGTSSTCLSLLSCPIQRGWECSEPSDELNLPDRLDLPLVPRDAFTSSWLWQRQTCCDTLAVAQSHPPRVSCFSLSLCCARCELCTDKPILISTSLCSPLPVAPSLRFLQIQHDCFI